MREDQVLWNKQKENNPEGGHQLVWGYGGFLKPLLYKGVAATHLNFKHHPEDERKGIMCNKVFLSTVCLGSTG